MTVPGTWIDPDFAAVDWRVHCLLYERASIKVASEELNEKTKQTEHEHCYVSVRTNGGMSVGWCIFASILSPCYDYLSVNKNRNRNRNDDHDDDKKSIKYQ